MGSIFRVGPRNPEKPLAAVNIPCRRCGNPEVRYARPTAANNMGFIDGGVEGRYPIVECPVCGWRWWLVNDKPQGGREP